MGRPKGLRELAAVALSAAILVWLAVTGEGATRPGWPQGLSIATAPVGGTYYVWGAAFAKILSDKVGIATTVEVTAGPVQNIRLVDAGQSSLAIATNGPVYEGWRGLDWAKGKQHTNMRVVLPMYASHFHGLVLAKHPIRSIRDLTGHPVGAGARGGTPDLYFRRVIEILGIKPSRIVNLGFQEMNDQTKDGMIVGYYTAVGPPQPSFTELETTHDVRIVGVLPEDARKVQEKFPYMLPGTLPAGTYKSQKEAVPNIVGFNLLIGHKDLPEDLVYALAKAAYDNHDALIAAHPIAKEMPPERMAHAPSPIHPGAIRYFREKGVQIPNDLIPPEAKR